MKRGTVVKVIPNMDGQDHFTQYEVDFGKGVIETFYETQLQPVKNPD
jgi:hypothetical protein